jgi:lipoprotein-anchoring transpeptidase ErfK/SrfK
MRFLIGFLAFLIAAGGFGYFAYRDLMAGPPVVLPPPTHLDATTARGQLLPGGWTNTSSVTLTAQGPKKPLGMDVEVRPQGQALDGSPTATSGADPSAVVHLADGRYRWQARLHGPDGVSPWVRYRGEVNVDTKAPPVTDLTSATDPDPTRTYHTSDASMSWTSTDAGSGVAGYSYRLDADSTGQAPAELRTQDSKITLTGLQTGQWYFHVRAQDNAGNWGPTVTFPLHIDVTPPGLAHVRFSAFQFNPLFGTMDVSFAVTRPARTVRVGVYRQSDEKLVRLYTYTDLARGDSKTVAWNGRNQKGIPVPPGSYELYIRAIDKYGHSSLTGWRDLTVDYKRIVINLSQQRLTAYDGTKVVLTTLVTTGNPKLPTPTGTFHVMAKFHPYKFISPWPKSSPYYYPPSKVEWALLFRAGGYFLHDAPWRTVFGPGSNTVIGTPGQNYTGTHGCVNLPSAAEQQLYAWADIGTVVQVVA